jgi:protein kinase A
MPTLGFLKKKRTREAAGPNDPTSPTTASSQPGSPITPTASKGFDNSIASISTQSTAFSQASPQVSSSQREDAVNEPQQMTQRAAPQQQALPQIHNSSPATGQNLPTIHNLINPPQHDGAGQSAPVKMASTTPSATSNSSVPAASSSPVKQTSIASTEQTQIRQTKGKYSLSDFQILRTLGTGSFGRVHLVQSRHNQRFYAVKVLKKQQVIKMKQVEHTNDERRMLQEVKHAFLITLWGTFQDSKNLYMVMDFVEGGELFSLLRKSQVHWQKLLNQCVLTDNSAFLTLWPSSMRRRSRLL